MVEDAQGQGQRVEPGLGRIGARHEDDRGGRPRRTPPNRQSAVYMIALTVRLAESRLGKIMTSAAPTTEPSIRFLAPASAA